MNQWFLDWATGWTVPLFTQLDIKNIINTYSRAHVWLYSKFLNDDIEVNWLHHTYRYSTQDANCFKISLNLLIIQMKEEMQAFSPKHKAVNSNKTTQSFLTVSRSPPHSMAEDHYWKSILPVIEIKTQTCLKILFINLLSILNLQNQSLSYFSDKAIFINIFFIFKETNIWKNILMREREKWVNISITDSISLNRNVLFLFLP